ncbi:MAG: hypothetical protein ACPG6P_08855 [Akkermansiaceae bacterium]
MSVKKDGSGTITEKTMFGQQMMMMLQMAELQGGAGGAGGAQANPVAGLMDKEKAKARAKKLGEGVELVSLDKIIKDGQTIGVKTVFKFADINKLTYSANSAMDMDSLPGAAKEQAAANKDAGVKFKFADGKLTIIQQAPKPAEGAEKPADGGAEGGAEKPAAPAIDPQMMAMVEGMMKDMRITTRVVIEPGIAKTNASHVEGNVITMSDIQMGKLIGQKDKLEAVQGGDFEKMKKALKGVEGIKFEDKETVEVTMK